MKLPANPFTQALCNKTQQIGFWVSMSNNHSAEVIAGSNFDWVLIDMEHSANDYFSVLSQLQTFAGYSTTALVRPQCNDPVITKRLLDLGVPGLLFPMIQSVEEAQLAVASTRYPPSGIRGVAGSSRATRYGRIADYATAIEKQTSVIVQIETTKALDNAEAIADVEGIHGIFFGPGDIAADLGIIGQTQSNLVWDSIMPVAEKLIAKGMPVGTLVLDADFAIQLFNRGFSFVACGADTALLAKSCDLLLDKVRCAIR